MNASNLPAAPVKRPALGTIGFALDVAADDAHLADAKQLEELGYRSIWLHGGQIDTLDRITQLVTETTEVRIATAIIPPDAYPAAEVAALYAALQPSAPDRFVVGLGATQRGPALPALHRYLDELDRAVPAVPIGSRLLAALGPRKLEVARTRFAGAIALLVTPAYTRHARAALGDDATLVIDQFVVLDTDAARARDRARRDLRFLSGVPGYRDNFVRMGFTDADISTLSDRLVDALVAWGDANAIAERIADHRSAGADHVIVAVLNEGDQMSRRDVAEHLAPLLDGVES